MKKSGEIALKTDVGKLDLARLPEEVTEIKDVSYVDDNDPGHKMDIYVRKDGTKKPVLFDIHGGGFISEDKAMNRLFGNYMARLGFVVFELNVRLAYPEWTVFDQIEDIDRGVRFALECAGGYEGDTDRLYKRYVLAAFRRDFGNDDCRVGIVRIAELRRPVCQFASAGIFAGEALLAAQGDTLGDHRKRLQQHRRSIDEPETVTLAAVEEFVTAQAELDERFASGVGGNERRALFLCEHQRAPFKGNVAITHWQRRVDRPVSPLDQRVVGGVKVGIYVRYNGLMRVAGGGIV